MSLLWRPKLILVTLLVNLNSTDVEALDYIHNNYLPNANIDEMDAIASDYPSNPRDGSPFNTHNLNAITPEFKRLAAIQGDLFFQGPRRLLLHSRSGKKDIWTYGTPLLRTPHD